jgi:pyruvate, water dikinase
VRNFVIRGVPVLALLLTACNADEPGGAARVRILSAGAALDGYRAVLARPSGGVVAVTCPGGRAAGLACASDGLTLNRSLLPAELSVKARGHAFRTVALPRTAGVSTDVSLEPLAPFERTATHATGFARTEENSAFDELAVTTFDELGESHSLKFYVEDIDAEPRVFFQDTRRFPRHFDFVTSGLGRPFSPAEFEARTYENETRKALAGTIISRPGLVLPGGADSPPLRAPVTLEFFPSDELTPELALRAHQLVEERLEFLSLGGNERRLVYVPAAAPQEAELAASRETFVAREAAFAGHIALYAGITEQLLNAGVAYGTLRKLSPDDLATTVVSRRDLLLLTRLPNDLPLVAGTITEELQTPLAHVNLAARARGTPNVAVPGASTDARIAPYVGELVRLEVTADDFTLSLASLEEAEAFWNARKPPPLEPESDASLEGFPPFAALGFDDAVRVGVKTANLSELRGLLGEQAPDGFAVPFSAFEAYLAANVVTDARCEAARESTEVEGRDPAACADVANVCAEAASDEDSFATYATRLTAWSAFTEDTVTREAALAGFRHLIENGDVDAGWASALDARVAETFGAGQVRLRSSTNVEDLAEFSGAGLYESVSAEASGERRASSRIRLIWASTWEYPAFEERSFWNVTEAGVRMGVAVTPAFDGEHANGVLVTANLSQPNAPGYYVNVQRGEFPVANPEGGMTPEVLTIVTDPEGNPTPVRQRFSSLSPGLPVLTDSDVAALADAAMRVEIHFAPLYGMQPSEAALDLEFKLLGPERAILIKQVRPYFDRSAP